MNSLSSGTLAGSGSFLCAECGYELSLARQSELPLCPRCGAGEFTRSSLFTNTVPESAAAAAPQEPWLAEARALVAAPGPHLAYRESEQVICVALEREWTRVGRSLSADIRFDDPTVSRRHALIVRGDDGVRVLDDRSLNGVFVNGERVEGRTLSDGDEIVVGRFQLAFLDPSAVASTSAEPAEPANAS
jgi:FHA domain-containing protein/zinc ribbon family protein